MTMAVSRRPARKSEPNLSGLNSISQCNSSPRRYNGSSALEISTGLHQHQHQRKRSWFGFWQSSSSTKSPMTSSSPSSPASSLYRPTILRTLLLEQLHRFKSRINRRNPIHVTILSITFLATWIILKYYLFYLLGPRGSIKGGQLGYIVDQYSRDYTRYKTISKWRREIASDLDLPIVYKEREGTLLEPWFFPFDVIIRTRPNTAVVEMLLREKWRVQKLEAMLGKAKAAVDGCSMDNKEKRHQVEIPTTILQLLPNHEQPSLQPYWISRSAQFDIDNISIHRSDIATPNLMEAIKRCQVFLTSNNAITSDSDVNCLAHYMGGMQLSNSIRMHQSRPLVIQALSFIGSSQTDKPHNILLGGGSCDSQVGYAVLSNTPTPDEQLRKTSAVASRVSTVFSAFPPVHPGSLCIPPIEGSIGISPYTEANIELSFQSVFANKLITELEGRAANSNSPVWGVATVPCGVEDATENTALNCCSQASVTILKATDAESIANYIKNDMESLDNNKQKNYIIFTSSKTTPRGKETANIQSTQQISVQVSEHSNKVEPTQRQKESIQMKLWNEWKCQPSWLCNRCLQSSIYGSFANCSFSCSKCAIDSICNGKDSNTQTSSVKVDVQVTRNQLPTSTEFDVNASPPNRIPRIIHQTYFEEITIEKYPQLVRLQNTWKASGWEYRFYNDDTARKYIESNYPSRFVSVFDSLSPGAYKADFFRCLVLYKEGGIYVDVDVMLNTNLDTFVTPDLAFFAPLDAVGSFADEQFCVWNGMIGSAPAHPVLTNVIEWMVNLVSSRGDMYDIERMVCRFSGMDKIENWKVRAEPSLMLTGPCALGLAVNNALGNEPLAKLRPGLLKQKRSNDDEIQSSNQDSIGNIMILLADKDDLGNFRFSDSERSIMIASTDLPGLSKSSLLYNNKDPKSKSSLRQKPHYSVSTRGQQLWGTHDVYEDELIVDEQVSLLVSYK